MIARVKARFDPFPTRRSSSRESTRLRQLGVSVLAALFLWLVLGLPYFIDHVPRFAGAALANRPISGKIVLIDIESGQNFSDASVAERQAEAVSLASAAGAEAIFVEGRFAESDTGIPALSDAIAASTVPVTIGWPMAYSADGNSLDMRVDRRASFPGAEETAHANYRLVTGFISDGESPFPISGRQWKSFQAAIAGAERVPGKFLVDYRYRVQDFSVFTLDDLEQRPSALRRLGGKRVVIGASLASVERTVINPANLKWVPIIFVDLLTAETIRGGAPLQIPPSVVLVIVATLLFIAAIMPDSPRRRVYAAVAMLTIVVPLVVAPFGPIIMMGSGVTLLLVYFTLRLRTWQRERASGIERMSGLPNFHALEDEYHENEGRLIIARVDNYEEILANLEPSLHPRFALEIAKRITVGGSSRIYTDTTGHFAWFDALEHAKGHVAGLLALSNAPITIGKRTFDFNCAFGLLDCRIEKPRQAISATLVAAGQAASRPTRIAYVSEQEGFDANWQLSLLASLDQAISKEQIYLAFQPQRDLKSNRIVGVEALVRWRHPERGIISPAQFIPQIERAGRLKPLTAHTVRLAARAAGEIRSYGVRVSVNASATLVSDDDFPALIHDNALAMGGNPADITVEITETARIPNMERAARNLQKLRDLGYGIALDDFGTGEANLSLLVALPCDELKIDRSFVVMSQHSERARMVISALCRATRMTGMNLVAEGIETDEDRETLQDLGCTIGQGYLLGKPQLLSQFFQTLQEQADNPDRKLTLY